MTVDRERLRQIDRIFDEALDLEGAERERFVDENCGADAELRESVERLLRAADRPQIQPGGALLGNFGDELLLHLEDDEHHPGSQVGPYRLIREIGTSGAAVVFLAAHEQDEFGEEVVLKLFRAEPESALSGWARKKSESWTDDITLVDGRTEPLEPELLEADADGAENQVPVDGELLGLEHPGIVELLDAGYAEDGRVFVIMEHVEGDRLDEYCDQRSLGIAERLELFVQLCEALQFAHSSLVTHGDLKLSSVLVDRSARVRLLDIGLAELLGTGSTTVLGRAARAGQGVWPDLRRLGEILLALLTGRRLRDESSGPRQPASEQVGAEGDVVHVALARARGLSPGELASTLRGDLDAIVERALESSPGRGYPTIEDLASDVRRYLDGRSVSARPRSERERTIFLLKSRAPVLAVVGLLGLLAGTVLGPRLLRTSPRPAENVQLERFVARLLEDADIADSGGRRVTARQLLDRGVQQVERSALPATAKSAELTILAGGYRQVGAYDRAVTVATQALAEARDAGTDEARLAGLLVNRAELELMAGLPVAISSAEEALLQATELDDDGLAAAADSVLGRALVVDDPPRAAAILQDALPRLGEGWIFEAQLAFARALDLTGDPGGAEVVLQEAAASARSVPGSRLGRVKSALGDHSLANGRPTMASEYYAESFEDYRAALGEVHWRIADVQRSLSQSRVAEGRLEDALEASRKALSVSRQVFGDRHLRTERARADFAVRLFDLGEGDRAKGLLLAVAAALETQLEPGAERQTLEALGSLGLVHHALGEYAEARAVFEKCAQRSSDASDADRAGVRVLLARSALAAGGGEQDSLRASLETALAEPGIDPAVQALGLAARARDQLQIALSDDELAETALVLSSAIDEATAVAGPGSWKVAEARAELAALHLALGSLEAAGVQLERAGAVLEGRGDPLEERYAEIMQSAG